MPKKALFVVTLLGSLSAHAECWTVGGLSGQSAMAYEQYKLSADRLKSQTFQIILSGSDSSISPSNGMSCSAASPAVLSCIAGSGAAITIETWAIDSKARAVYYTKVRSGYGSVDGATLLVGAIHGPCK